VIKQDVGLLARLPLGVEMLAAQPVRHVLDDVASAEPFPSGDDRREAKNSESRNAPLGGGPPSLR
jgi:hypothetical protein